MFTLAVEIATERAGERGDQDVIDRAAEHAADGSHFLQFERLTPGDVFHAAMGCFRPSPGRPAWHAEAGDFGPGDRILRVP